MNGQKWLIMFLLTIVISITTASSVLSAPLVVSVNKKAEKIGGNVVVNWSGFGGNVNVIVQRGNSFWTYAITDAPDNSLQTLTIYNDWQIRNDYTVKVEKRSNTAVFAVSNVFSISSPSASIDKAVVEKGQKVRVTWSGFSDNVNLKVMRNGEFWNYANTNVVGSGFQDIVVYDEWLAGGNYHYQILVESRIDTRVNIISSVFNVEEPDAIPTISFTSPVGSGGSYSTSSSSVSIGGVASDNAKIRATQIQVNNGSWLDIVGANGFPSISWNQSVSLTPGVNIISAKTEDDRLQWSPTTSITITYNQSDTYSWNVGQWGACTNVCGVGVRNRTVQCQNQNGSTVSDSYCSAKPATQEACNDLSGCPPTPIKSEQSKYDQYFDEAGKDYHVPSNLLRAIAYTESKTGTDPNTYSGPGGYGIMQLELDTDKLNTYLDIVRTEYSLTRTDLKNLAKQNTDAGNRANIRIAACKLNYDADNATGPTGKPLDLMYAHEPKDSLEAWWMVVANYNGGGADGDVTTSNYPYRVYNNFLTGVQQANNDGTFSTLVPRISITLPPHFYYRKAVQAELDKHEATNADATLIPATPVGFIRKTLPFDSCVSLYYLHDNAGLLLDPKKCPGSSSDEFGLLFPLKTDNAGNSIDASTAPINSVYDYTNPDYHTEDGYVMSYTEEIGKYGSDNYEGGYKNSQGTNFTVNGNYTGAKKPSYLFYDGHEGVDYRASSGKSIYATADGVFVIDAEPDGKNSTLSQAHINHDNGYRTIYLHCRKFFVSSGKSVKAGQLIGEVGEEGSPGQPHLHLQISYDGVPVDPYGWLANQDDNNQAWTRAKNSTLWAKNNGDYEVFAVSDITNGSGGEGALAVVGDILPLGPVSTLTDTATYTTCTPPTSGDYSPKVAPSQKTTTPQAVLSLPKTR